MVQNPARSRRSQTSPAKGNRRPRGPSGVRGPQHESAGSGGNRRVRRGRGRARHGDSGEEAAGTPEEGSRSSDGGVMAKRKNDEAEDLPEVAPLLDEPPAAEAVEHHDAEVQKLEQDLEAAKAKRPAPIQEYPRAAYYKGDRNITRVVQSEAELEDGWTFTPGEAS